MGLLEAVESSVENCGGYWRQLGALWAIMGLLEAAGSSVESLGAPGNGWEFC